MDDSGFAFIIMVKGMKNFIHDQIRQHKGSFESSLGNKIAEFGVYGKTIHTFLYASDTRKRYIHMYYSAAKAAGERARFEENIQQMQRYLDANRNVKGEFGPAFEKYFFLHQDQDSGVLVYAKPKLQVIQDELELCGYFAIITSEKMNAKQAINLYKSRDASEKLFRADKSSLGNGVLRVASQEAADNKIFIGFIALIIRCRIYTALKDKVSTMVKKPNYFTVPAAIRELEKIELSRQLDNVYRMDHAVTKAQREILSAFGIEGAQVKYKATFISEALREGTK